MDLKEITKRTPYVKGVFGLPERGDFSIESTSFEKIFVSFEDKMSLLLTANCDTDEFIINGEHFTPDGMIDLLSLYPALSDIKESVLLWTWEMNNHQGYFDAIQFEFWNKTLKKELILQLKITASSIYMYNVVELKQNRNIYAK
ncbi:MAG: hypothetical protein LBV54_00475 [Puniceicoccales bacterium]|jgi:hypothetical protein|nr:hypothetical protein [Puniceicoccales bacterium]